MQTIPIAIDWIADTEKEEEVERLSVRYMLKTSLDESVPENVWEFYKVIRQVEDTFKTLKSDLEIRPVYHKKYTEIKAHLNLAVMEYWIFSTARHRLKLKASHGDGRNC